MYQAFLDSQQKFRFVFHVRVPLLHSFEFEISLGAEQSKEYHSGAFPLEYILLSKDTFQLRHFVIHTKTSHC